MLIGGPMGSATSIVTLTATGANEIATQGSSSIVTGQSVSVTSNGGGIIMSVSTSSLSANTSFVGGKGLVTLFNKSANPLTLENSAAGNGFLLESPGPVTIKSISSDGGVSSTTASIEVSAKTGSLTVVGGSTIKAVGGNVSLISRDTKDGSINIGANSTITASSTGQAGNVFVNIGAKVNKVAGQAPPNVQQHITGNGKIFFGKRGIFALAPDNTLNAKDREIVFDSDDDSAGAIQLGGGVTITADPPDGAPSVAPMISAPLNSMRGTNVPRGSTSFARPPLAPDGLSLPNVGSKPWPTPGTEGFGKGVTNGLMSRDVLVAFHAPNTASANWISETEVAGREIPAIIYSDTDLGITSDPALALAQSANPNVPIILDRGSVLFAPAVDRTIDTPFGIVEVDAGSLVLVLSFGSGLAVYDLYDPHRGAASVSVNDQRFALHPGFGLVVTSNSVRSFEQINPAQDFGYRNIVVQEIGGGLKAFSSEFVIPSALQAVQPLKELVHSEHPNARRLRDKLLKTSAALLTIRSGSKRFEQVLRSQ